MTLIAPPTETRPMTKVAYLHELTYPEVLESKIPVIDQQGKLWGGPDRKGGNAPGKDHLFNHWRMQVVLNVATAPTKVLEYYESTRSLGRAPRGDETIGGIVEHVSQDQIGKRLWEVGGEPFTVEGIGGVFYPAVGGGAKKQKILANPPRFATSYSGMKDFLNCPCKWAAAKYFKTLPFIEGPEAAWGNRVHTAFERAIGTIIGYKGEKAIPEDITIIKDNGWSQFLKAIIQAWKKGATVEVERELCFTKDLRPCGWKDWNTVWFRFKGDVHIHAGHRFFYYDWKTGKRYSKRGDDQADVFQLEVAWAIVSLYYPDVEEFTGVLIFLQEKDDLTRAIVKRRYTRADLPGIWQKIFDITGRMEQAWETENFRMQTSGLCRNHCGNTSCPHCGTK